MKLTNANVVITGGSEGLGFALAKAFVDRGALVHLIGRSEDKLKKAQQELGEAAMIYPADVSNLVELQAVAAKISSPQVLINNAGGWLEGAITENTEEHISRILDTNLKGVIYTTKAFLPALLTAPEAHLINVSSTSGLKGRENQAVYAASKFGVAGFTESMKIDLEKTNIKVSGFYPGGMSTGLFATAGNPKSNSDWMDPSKVAAVVVFMVEQDATMVIDHIVINKRQAQTSN